MPAARKASCRRRSGDSSRSPKTLLSSPPTRTCGRCSEELAGTENKIGAARQFYNNLATKYNAATEVIPGNIIAGFAGFKAAELFEITSDAERAAPSVNVSGRAEGPRRVSRSLGLGACGLRLDGLGS